MTISDSIFAYDDSGEPPSFAGGLYNTGTATIMDSSFVAGSSGSEGVANFASLTVSGSTFADNGGGLYIGNGTTSILNSTIANNEGALLTLITAR